MNPLRSPRLNDNDVHLGTPSSKWYRYLCLMFVQNYPALQVNAAHTRESADSVSDSQKPDDKPGTSVGLVVMVQSTNSQYTHRRMSGYMEACTLAYPAPVCLTIRSKQHTAANSLVSPCASHRQQKLHPQTAEYHQSTLTPRKFRHRRSGHGTCHCPALQ